MDRMNPAGAGRRWLALTTATQLLLGGSALAHAWLPVAEPPLPRLVLHGAAVVQEPFGDAGSLAEQTLWAPGARVQLSLQSDARIEVLWFSGDAVSRLHPRPGSAGTAALTLAIPGPGSWMKLTATPPGGDLVVAIAGPANPRIDAALTRPTADAVAALRDSLARAAAVYDDDAAVSRFLPTADGRAVPVPWERAEGTGRAVLAWTIETPTASVATRPSR